MWWFAPVLPVTAPTLYREIDALGGADDHSWNLALVEVLKILERRGFSEAQDSVAIENPPAFPEVPGDFNAYEGRAGMALRDWLAGQAPVAWAEARALCGWSEDEDFTSDSTRAVLFTIMAMLRYQYADAMLAARVTPTPVSTFSADAAPALAHPTPIQKDPVIVLAALIQQESRNAE